jgi:winged helix-turn-helix protein/methyltransferase family protein
MVMVDGAMESSFDKQKAEAFAGRLLTALNDGALCLMASIGHRAGLFDAMCNQPPQTSDEIASRAGLNERYVREWLGAMVTSGVVIVDSQSLHDQLPAEHAAYLTRAAGANNFAAYTQYVPILGQVEEAIIECFRNGGGVPYEQYPRFHAVMAEDSGTSVLSSLESHILPLVRGLADRLARGIRGLDAGCGSGRILTAKGLKNVEFEAVDLGDFDRTAVPESFDLVTTFDAVHDQAKPLNLLKGIHRALKSGGVYVMQDIRGSSVVHNNINHPVGTFLYTASCLHCMTVSLAQNGEGLGAMWLS